MPTRVPPSPGPGPRALATATMTALLVAVPPAAAATDPPRADFRSPLARVSVATPFDPPTERWLAGHRGVDLVASPSEAVRAPADGVVVFAGPVGGRPVLSIDHGAGLRTTYEPLLASVRSGDPVRTGETVGRLIAGHPGCPAAACLHWGALLASGGPTGDDDEYLDPLDLLASDRRPIRLKPTLPGDGVS